MVCEHCHHSNPDAGHYCGKCGEPLVHQTEPVVAGSAGPSHGSSSISILQLDDDELDSPNYLLEDEPKRRSHRPIFMVLVLLAVVGGLGYLYWHRVYAPLAYVQPPAPDPVAPPMFAYQKTSPLDLANTQLAMNMETPKLLIPRSFDAVRLQAIAQNVKEAADPHNNPNYVAGKRALSGKGVAQSCKAAVEHFKAAAKEGNAPALAELGVLSASGHCMRRNRVQAYRWFARAKEADPSNTWLDRSMDMLWANMSRHERNVVMK